MGQLQQNLRIGATIERNTTSARLKKDLVFGAFAELVVVEELFEPHDGRRNPR